MKTDLSYLIELSDGNKELITEMVEIFYLQVEEFVKDMDTHLANENWKALGQVAHKAKSSVSIMGMHDLAKDLKKMEQLSKQEKEKNKYPSIIKKFKSDCKIAIEELKNYIDNN
ncbi:MAG: Hpt domain-containing protein [Bacteroidota bacterium]